MPSFHVIHSHGAKAHRLPPLSNTMECVTLLRQELQNILKHQNDFNNHISVVRCFTCGVVPQKLVVSIYNGRCGCPPQHTSRGHIGVRFRVNVLYTFPWHSWLELCDRREKRIRLKQGNAIYWNWRYFKKVNNCLLHCSSEKSDFS